MPGKRTGARMKKEAPSPVQPTLELTPEDALHQPLPDNLPAEMFSGPGMLALADLLPVMTGYFDSSLRLQFINKLFAEWLEKPRSELLGRTMEEILGSEAFSHRRPMIEAALAGERQFFVADLNHPTRGPLVAQSEYVPWVRPGGEVIGFVVVVQDVTEQRVAERALK